MIKCGNLPKMLTSVPEANQTAKKHLLLPSSLEVIIHAKL